MNFKIITSLAPVHEGGPPRESQGEERVRRILGRRVRWSPWYLDSVIEWDGLEEEEGRNHMC